MALTKVTGQVIKNTTDVTVGVLTVTNTLAVGGTVSIGGTLTYEDVTNVDAVGLITARNGIVVGSGITLSKDGDGFFTGVTTATTFVGALTGNVTGNLTGDVTGNVTGTASGNPTLSSGADNRVITASSATALTGESNVNIVSGNLITGHTASTTVSDGEAPFIQVKSTDSRGGISLLRHSANAGGGGVYIGKSRNATIGSNTIVQDGDELGRITFCGDDGTDVHTQSAAIHAFVDGTPGSNDMPGSLRFYTNSGTTSVTERLRITSGGLVGVGQATPTHMLHVDSSSASDSTATAFFKGRIVRVDGAAASNSPRVNFSLDGTDKTSIMCNRNDSSLNIETLTSAPIIFDTNSTERLRIESAGNVNFANNVNVSGTSTVTGIAQFSNTINLTHASAGQNYIYFNEDLQLAKNGTGTRLKIDSDGRVLIGQSTQYAGAFGSTPPKFSVSTTVASPAIFGTFSNNAYGSRIDLLKSRNTTVGSHTIVQDGDSVGDIVFGASDGDQFHAIAEIKAMVDGTPGDNDTPGRLQFQTTSDGGSSTANRMTIDSNGHVTKPYQPFFSVYGTGSNVTYNEGDEIDFENATHNVGSHFKMTSGTGQYKRFIAPVAGVYIFTFGFFPNSSSNCRISLAVNGSVQTSPYISGCFTAWGAGVSVPMGAQMLKLSASDYVTVVVQIGTLTNTYDGHTGFQGYLLG